MIAATCPHLSHWIETYLGDYSTCTCCGESRSHKRGEKPFEMTQEAFEDAFSDAALGQRTPEAIAQDDRQAADPYSDARYYDALVVIANEQGAGRYARAINLVAKIWQKTPEQVLSDAVML